MSAYTPSMLPDYVRTVKRIIDTLKGQGRSVDLDLVRWAASLTPVQMDIALMSLPLLNN